MRPKNRGAASLILALTVVSIAGCGDKNIKQLTPGIARDSVLKLLALGSTPAPGDTTPNVYREERYLNAGHWITIVLYSNTGRKEGTGEVVPEGDLTPVVLRDDTLTGWGWEHHDSVAQANNIVIKPRNK